MPGFNNPNVSYSQSTHVSDFGVVSWNCKGHDKSQGLYQTRQAATVFGTLRHRRPQVISLWSTLALSSWHGCHYKGGAMCSGDALTLTSNQWVLQWSWAAFSRGCLLTRDQFMLCHVSVANLGEHVVWPSGTRIATTLTNPTYVTLTQVWVSVVGVRLGVDDVLKSWNKSIMYN